MGDRGRGSYSVCGIRQPARALGHSNSIELHRFVQHGCELPYVCSGLPEVGELVNILLTPPPRVLAEITYRSSIRLMRLSRAQASKRYPSVW